ncbi:MAG TPA: class I SAM-dependent methyltransferase [Alphaproteobacteria bacterium]|nr:class I SAM-dependent methyltransferase [Alphaproteobacteria bacterium]
MKLPPRLRRLGFGLSTTLGLAQRGFFIPFRHADRLPPPGRTDAYPAIAALMAARREAFSDLLVEFARHREAFARFDGAEPPLPRWGQDWFPRLDAAAAYALVARHRPRRIVEVGSGHSTRFMARAVIDGGFDCDFTAIDPQPRADIARLPVRHIQMAVQNAPQAIFATLEAGDVLFIDSSHVLMPGTDVDLLFGTVLPALPPGVLVHIHDIFLPDDYPAAWTWRGYNEQQGVFGLLAGGWAPLWSSRYVATRMAAEVAASRAGELPLTPGAWETSLWLRREG